LTRIGPEAQVGHALQKGGIVLDDLQYAPLVCFVFGDGEDVLARYGEAHVWDRGEDIACRVQEVFVPFHVLKTGYHTDQWRLRPDPQFGADGRSVDARMVDSRIDAGDQHVDAVWRDGGRVAEEFLFHRARDGDDAAYPKLEKSSLPAVDREPPAHRIP